MKYCLKLFLFLCCLWLWQAYSFPVFAASETADSISKSIHEIIMAFLNFLARGWVIPATIAGKLMTNEFVYGKAIHMANFMRRVWTIMRQLANYAVGLIFLYQIFKTIVTGEEVSKLKDTLFSVVKATLLINISWFAIAALVDLSIVGVAAVGAIPATVLETKRDSLKNNYFVPAEFVISRDDTKLLGYDLTKSGTGEFALGDIIPQADNVSGPLFFLGVSVFKTFNIPYIDPAVTTRSTITLDALLKLFIVALFAIPLIILSIVNMMRIFRLWIVIMLSPILAIDWAFDLKISGKTDDKQAKKLFEPYELFALIFQPVVTIAALGLCLILIIGIRDIVDGGTKQGLDEIANVLCLTVDSEKESTIGPSCGNVSFTKIVGAGFGGTILHLLLALLASFLLWMIVKLSLNFSSITAGVAGGLYDFSEKALGAMPIPGTEAFGGGRVGASSLMDTEGKYMKAQTDRLQRNISGGSTEAANELSDKIYGLVPGLEKAPRDLTREQATSLDNAMNDRSKPNELFLNKLQNVLKDSPKQFNQIQGKVDTWLAQSTTKTWFDKQAPSLKITAELLKDGKIYTHQPFVRFMDAILSGNSIADAIARGITSSSTTVDLNKKGKVYGGKK